MAEKLAERLLSVKEFLEWESKQPFRHELIGGRVIEMTGASPSHNRINLNLAFALENRLESRGCEVFAIDIGVLVDLEGTYVYPDVIVVCGEQKFRTGALQTTLENPTLLFEILSPTTESFDRNQKYKQYLQIPSLEGYFLVAQDRPRIEAAIRDGDTWRHRVSSGLEASLAISSLGCELPLSEVYRQVRFEDVEVE